MFDDVIERYDSNGKMISRTDERTLDVAIANRCDVIDAMYKAAITQSFPFRGKMIQMRDDEHHDDRKNIGDQVLTALVLKSLGSWNPAFSWTTEDNTELPLPTPDDMIALGLAADQFVLSWRDKQQAAKAIVRSATTNEMADSVSI